MSPFALLFLLCLFYVFLVGVCAACAVIRRKPFWIFLLINCIFFAVYNIHSLFNLAEVS